MTLAEYLRIPYVLESESIEVAAGTWVRRVAYPEFPGCWAEAEGLEEALDQLERRRVEHTVELLREGKCPPLIRQPLHADLAPWSMERLGLTEAFGSLLHQDETPSTVPSNLLST
jgi:predicted RNase H-like HicB family nuclease